MGQLNNLTRSIVFVFALALPFTSLASHSDLKEAPFTLLFKNSPARIGRDLSSSNHNPHPLPTLTFDQKITLNSQGEARIGKSCLIRDVSLTQVIGTGVFSAPLTHNPGAIIAAGSSFEMGIISFQDESLQLDLISRDQGTKQRFEFGCAHPGVSTWSVTDFETHLGHVASVRVPSSLADEASRLKSQGNPSPSLTTLKGFRYNGAFGSGLPGTAGVQLLMGANLNAYTNPSDTTLMVGRRCQMVSQTGASLTQRYVKGTKFAFLGFKPNDEKGTVEMVFANWNHSPHQLRIECLGSESDLKKLAFVDIESDLNGALRFYTK